MGNAIVNIPSQSDVCGGSTGMCATTYNTCMTTFTQPRDQQTCISALSNLVNTGGDVNGMYTRLQQCNVDDISCLGTIINNNSVEGWTPRKNSNFPIIILIILLLILFMIYKHYTLEKRFDELLQWLYSRSERN